MAGSMGFTTPMTPFATDERADPIEDRKLIYAPLVWLFARSSVF
jgi:hypothetical protein